MFTNALNASHTSQVLSRGQSLPIHHQQDDLPFPSMYTSTSPPPPPPIYSQKTSLQQLQQWFSWERSIWEAFNMFLTVFQCSLAAGSQVQSQSKGFILCYCTLCLFPLALSGKTALPWMPSYALITRMHRTASCTAGSYPCPWSWAMIYLKRTNCMFHALRTTDNWKLTSTWQACFG